MWLGRMKEVKGFGEEMGTWGQKIDYIIEPTDVKEVDP